MMKKTGKLLAAHVVVYKDSDESYDGFISPEAYHAYSEYRNVRMKYGEKITKDSPVLLRRFNVKRINPSSSVDSRPISKSTISMLLRVVTHKAGVREPSGKYNARFNIKQAHGYRKFFATVLSNAKTKDGRPAIDFLRKEQLLGHALTGIHTLENNYNRTSRQEYIKLLLDEYLKALPELTISDEERMKVEVRKLQTDISNMKSVEMQLAAKDKEVENLKQDMSLMQESQKEILDLLKDPIKLLEILKEK
jgi:hypothetical protein